jgi:alcohol dehydrogenase, propanol-preferring
MSCMGLGDDRRTAQKGTHMKAAVLTDFRSPLQLQTRPDPEPGAGEAVVRIEASGVCRSDWHFWNGDWNWLGLTPQFPLIQGHEIGGVVAEVGPDVHHFKAGDRVTIPFHLACGRCEYCTGGRSHLCHALGFVGFTSDGGFAQAIKVPSADSSLVRLPDAVDYVSAAALACRYMTAYHGIVDRAQVKSGEWVAVFGIGGLGLSTVQVAAAMGARVVAVGRSADKLAQARAEGAVAAVDASQPNVADRVKEITGEGADVAVDALGASATALPAILSLRKGGRLLQMGLTGQEDKGMISLPVDAMVLQELSIIAALGCPTSSYPALLGMVASGQLNPKRLVGRMVSLEDISSVYHDMSGYKTHGFSVITDLQN